jgi:hypothetical protein
VTFVNTNGMAFIGPGSEWFWAALQFTALSITFVAVYRQLRNGQSQRAVEQVARYSRQFGDERMARYRLAVLVALRDGMEMPMGVGIAMANYFEEVATLTRSGHLNIKLLWSTLGIEFKIWWFVLQSLVERGRAVDGAGSYTDWEWLVGEFVEMDRRSAGLVTIDAEYVANWRAGGVIGRIQDRIRVEQALRSVVMASPDGTDLTQSAAAVPAPAPSPSLTADHEQERQSD